jgi:zinc D-Ala-D-Ala dipeptidase
MQVRARDTLSCLMVAIAVTLVATQGSAAALPDGFVYLRDIDPTILEDMRYAGSNNLTGAPVPGYDAPECVLVRQAAEALKQVEADLRDEGLTLKVYDCYRPARAVAAFGEWGKKPDDPAAKINYYPNLPKAALFPDYIAIRSGHSRGATVDITLAPIGDTWRRSAPEAGTVPQPCTAPQQNLAPDGSLAMGTRFDCLDEEANTAAPGLTKEEQDNRARLLKAMQARGFTNYPKEWWHFTLTAEPYPDTIFDFPIVPRQ